MAAFIWFASGIFYGLPQELDPDEQLFVRGAGNILANRTLDPGWYGAPAQLLVYLLERVAFDWIQSFSRQTEAAFAFANAFGPPTECD